MASHAKADNLLAMAKKVLAIITKHTDISIKDVKVEDLAADIAKLEFSNKEIARLEAESIPHLEIRDVILGSFAGMRDRARSSIYGALGEDAEEYKGFMAAQGPKPEHKKKATKRAAKNTTTPTP